MLVESEPRQGKIGLHIQHEIDATDFLNVVDGAKYLKQEGCTFEILQSSDLVIS